MFFTEFTFDTLLGLLSVILGIIALLVGGKAYYHCRKMRTTFKDKKKFEDNSEDHSQQAGGDIINYTCDPTALANLNAANFDSCLKMAYSTFEEQAKSNLQQIIEQTKHIIETQKPNIAGLTKVDWINIYFESAKNTSDQYMQNVWAKVLAREIEKPGSFSYKTLDVLKNMSADEFKLFEKLCSMVVDDFLPEEEDIFSRYGLNYLDIVKLNEYGLLNMSLSQRLNTIQPHGVAHFVYCHLLVLVTNQSDKEIKVTTAAYLLTSVAKELQLIATRYATEAFAKDFVNILSKKNRDAIVTLHRINSISGKEINYQKEDISLS